MSPGNANDLKKEIDDVLRGDVDIKKLLQLQDRSEHDKDFIQKYAETQMTYISIQITFLAYIFALLFALIGIGIAISAISYFFNIDILLFLAAVAVLILACVLFFYFRVTYPKLFSKIYTKNIDILRDIIIAVQDSKLETQDKLDEIKDTIDTINEKCDDLKNVVSSEFEIIKRDVVSLKKTEEK